MRDKKNLILIIYFVVILGVILYLSRPLEKPGQRIGPLEKTKAGKRIQETDAAELKREVWRVKELIQSFVQMNRSLNNELDERERQLKEERRKSRDLYGRLNELSLKNEMLNKELASKGKALAQLEELTQPIRRRFEGLESTFEGISASLVTLGFSPGKEKQLRKQLASLEKELDAIDRQVPRLIKENKGYRQQAEELESLLDRKEGRIRDLEEKLKDGMSLARELQEVIVSKSRLEKELGGLQEKNSLLEERLREKQAGMEKLENKLKQEQARAEKKSGELEEFLSAKSSLDEEISRLRQDKTLLKNQLDEKAAQIESLENRL
ncbi:MAG: hypothetical protein ABIH40_03845, partial [Candidatus Omnitrophota bacterium]